METELTGYSPKMPAEGGVQMLSKRRREKEL